MDLCSENFMQVTDLLFLLKLMKEALRLLFRARRFLSYDVTSHCSSFSDCRSCVPWLKRMRIGQEFKSLYCVCRFVLFHTSTCILWPHYGEQVLVFSSMSDRLAMWELLQVRVSWLRSLLLIKYVIDCVVAFEMGAQCFFIGLRGLDQTCITFAFRLDYGTCCL